MPEIREFTIQLLRGLTDNDIVGQITRVVAFVRQNVTYVRDPDGTEYVTSPVRMIRGYVNNHYMAGDCDDHTMLLNSMLTSIGIQTCFIGVKYGNSDHYNHVISGVYIGGKLHQVDPCAKNGKDPVYDDVLIV